MGKKYPKLFTAPDIYRVTKAADVESIRDAGLIALCIIMLTTKLSEYVQWIQPPDPMVVKADPVTFAVRLLLYRPELEKWRSKHPEGTKFAQEISRDRDFNAMFTYIINNVDRLAMLIPR